MLARLLRWLRGRPAPASRPHDVAPPPRPAGDPYRGPEASPAPDPPPTPARRTSWWPHRLIPPGVLAELDVYALFHGVPILYMCTNDLVFVVAGRTHVLDHVRCEPMDTEFARYMPHTLRDAAAAQDATRRRLTSVPAIEVFDLPLVAEEGKEVVRQDEPAPSRDGPRVDLAPQLRRELARHLAADDRPALASLFALLDLLARFDGHTRGEIELLASRVYHNPEPTLRVHLGACDPAVLRDRVDDPTRARVLAELAAGITATGDELRVHALVDKSESLNGCSGHAARLCLARLVVTPTAFAYDDELLWSEYERGSEYS